MANNLTAEAVHEQLLSLANPEIAEHSQRFFKTGAGEYGEGDQFLGIRVPVLRQQVTRYQKLPNDELIRLLQSPFHEERLFALLIWVKQFQTGSEKDKPIYTISISAIPSSSTTGIWWTVLPIKSWERF